MPAVASAASPARSFERAFAWWSERLLCDDIDRIERTAVTPCESPGS
jgi:hypothetical protein